jgi:hypothetical protein
MSSKYFLMAVVALLVLSSCGSTSKTASDGNATKENGSTSGEGVNVPYIIAQRYFVRNDYNDGDLKNPKITSKELFNGLFGMATIMGPNGRPTDIDFEKQYVLAVIGQETNRSTSIDAVSLKQKDNIIEFRYKVVEGDTMGATIQPVLLIIVDKKYDGEVRLVEVQK